MKPAATPSVLFRLNRDRLRALLPKSSLAILNANDIMPTNADGTMGHHQNADLYYLTGVRQEETILVLAPDAVDEKLREVLFLREPSEHLATWEGHKLGKDEARRISGIENVKWLAAFPGALRQLMCESERVYLNSNEHSRAVVEVESRDARFVRECRRRYPLHEYRRLAPLMHQLRAVKGGPEIELIRRACDLTRDGLLRVMRFVKPGVGEAEVEAELAHEFIRRGGRFAYPPIIAAGANNCVLHYGANDQVCRRGQLLLLDVGASCGGYMSDLTRTIPVSGRFSRRQRRVYNAVLRVFRALVKELVPGKRLRETRAAAEALVEKELIDLGLLTAAEIRRQDPENPAVRRYLMHGVSHPIGLDVHDVHPADATIAAGWVVTCEPAIYVKEEGFGIRLENTIWVTEKGAVDLMADIPIEADEIEEIMNG